MTVRAPRKETSGWMGSRCGFFFCGAHAGRAPCHKSMRWAVIALILGRHDGTATAERGSRRLFTDKQKPSGEEGNACRLSRSIRINSTIVAIRTAFASRPPTIWKTSISLWDRIAPLKRYALVCACAMTATTSSCWGLREPAVTRWSRGCWNMKRQRSPRRRTGPMSIISRRRTSRKR